VVFEGGGAKGMVFVGAMQEFGARGYTYDRLVDTSAGSITAALLAAGYNSSRMLDALGEQADGEPVFAAFLGVPGPFPEAQVQSSLMVDLLTRIDIPLVSDRWEHSASIGITSALLKIDRFCNLFSFVEMGGWYSASTFVDWMTAKLDVATDGRRTGYGTITLAEFFEATGKGAFRAAHRRGQQRHAELEPRDVFGRLRLLQAGAAGIRPVVQLFRVSVHALVARWTRHRLCRSRYGRPAGGVAERGHPQGGEPKRSCCFSHQQLFSRLDNPGREAGQGASHLLESGRIAAWYWGHEHQCVIYNAHPRDGLFGCCIGNGSRRRPR
jgi:hypothetical protein